MDVMEEYEEIKAKLKEVLDAVKHDGLVLQKMLHELLTEAFPGHDEE